MEKDFNRRCVLAVFGLLALTALIVSLTGCEPTVVHLDPRVADPGYPIVLIQSTGCSNGTNPNPGTLLGCSFHQPASSQDPVFVIYWASGAASLQDDGNDSFSSFAPSVSKPGTGSSIYFYSTLTQGTSWIGIQPGPNVTVSAVALLELSGGASAGVVQNSYYYSNSCGPNWICETNPVRFESSAVSISKSSILIAAQLGIPSACSYEGINPDGSPGFQMYQDQNTFCYGYDYQGFKVLYSTPGSGFINCGSACGFTVEVAISSAPIVAPFFVYNQPSYSPGSSWVAAEMAIQ